MQKAMQIAKCFHLSNEIRLEDLIWIWIIRIMLSWCSAMRLKQRNHLICYLAIFNSHIKLTCGIFNFWAECIPALCSFNMWESGLWSYVTLSIVLICWRLLIVVAWTFRWSTKKTKRRKRFHLSRRQKDHRCRHISNHLECYNSCFS